MPLTHLTFDCYGTLIDWETGILRAIRPVLSIHGVRSTDDELLELYGRLESRAESGPYRPYRDILREVMAGIGAHFGLNLEARELDRLPDSVGQWPAFPDTAAALARLSEHFVLTVVSNVDDDLFEGSRDRLESAGATIDRLVSAQLCRSYKPSHRNFRVALALLDVPTDRLLHVAQSLYHDIRPARELGLRTAWVNRRRGKPSTGATPPVEPSVRPDLEVPDMKSLADQLCDNL
ncbi:MAG: haloacid dehalogenase type II [Phycisphaerales bacterium]|nr:haloacid dehalogenase type II [Phycisphaerales bacterium]